MCSSPLLPRLQLSWVVISFQLHATGNDDGGDDDNDDDDDDNGKVINRLAKYSETFLPKITSTSQIISRVMFSHYK